MKNIKKAYEMKNIHFRSLCYALQSAPLYGVVYILSIVITGVAPAIQIYLSIDIIDSLVNLIGSRDMSILFKPLFLWIGILVISEIISHINSYLIYAVSEKLKLKIISDINGKCAELKEISLFENCEFQDRIQLLRDQISSKPLNLIGNISLNLRMIVSIVSVIVVLSQVTLLAPLFILLSAVPKIYLKKRSGSKEWDLSLSLSGTKRLMENFFQTILDPSMSKDNILNSVASKKAAWLKKEGNHFISESLGLRMKYLRFSALCSLISTVFTGGAFAVTIKQLLLKSLGAGSAAAFLQGFMRIQMEFLDLIQFLSYYFRILEYYRSLFDVLDHPVRKNGHIEIKSIDSIEFQNVSFRYPDTDVDVLKDINWRICPRENTAIVGENGAGKSTLLKLLLGFYLPTQGTIKINGFPLQDIDMDDYRLRISAIFQDFSIYRGFTLKENLSLCHSFCDFNRISEKNTRLMEKWLPEISLENKNTVLGKSFSGPELSGGQWQKLAAVRALSKDFSFLIADEPTASIDPVSEARFNSELLQISEGKGSIIITHRLGTVNKADRILCLQKGRIVEEGSFEVLMQNKNYFYSLYKAQSEQYSNVL